MPFASYQWRAGKGYLPPPDAVPQLITTMPAGPTLYAYPYGGPLPSQYAHVVAHPSIPPVVAAAPPPPKKKSVSLPPPPPSSSAAPSKASSGPKTIIQGKDWRIVGKPLSGTGKWTITIPPPPPPPSAAPASSKKITIPPPPPCSTISPADSVSSTGSGTSLGSAAETGWKSKTKTQVTKKSGSGNSSSSKKATTTTTKLTHLQLRGGGGGSSSPSPPPPPPSTITPPSAALSRTCPTLPPGTNYLFPLRSSHTILHIFNKTRPVWEEKYQNGEKMHEFKMFKVAVRFTVREVVERVVGGSGKKGKGDGEGLQKWAVTECHEQGGGRWKKGTTIPYASDRAAGSLESMGWDAKRGKERSPVWLVVHRV